MISIFSGTSNLSLPDVDNESLLHKIWLQDAVGHADYIKCNLDPTEKPLRKALKEFKMHLLNNEEFMQYNTHIADGNTLISFPRSILHTERINKSMSEFIDLLSILQEGKASNSILSAFSELVPDHMYREECYYLCKLGYDAPDPTAPRIGN